MLINHLSFCRKVIRMPVLILVIYPTISSLAAALLSIISEEIEALDKIINQSLSVLLETLLRNELALKHKRVIDIAKECVRFGEKDIFVSSVTVNTRRSSAFISVVNNILQDKCATFQFHFIDNSNIKREHLWKDGLHLNPSGKDLLMNNFFA